MFFLRLKNNKGPARTCLRGGFTLVEMMVAIAVFSIVMVTAMSALLNVIDANNKARAIKTAVNNVNFALDSISRDMRVGTEYSCSDDGGASFGGDCPNGGDAISFKSKKDGEPYLFYRYVPRVPGVSPGRLESCSDPDSGTFCVAGYSAITSADVDLTNVRFYVQRVQDPVPLLGITQPYVIITISGKAGSKAKIETTFDLQTSVAQRNRISPE